METVVDINKNNLNHQEESTPSKIKKSTNDNHVLVSEITPCKNPKLFFSLTLRALGVIFGDIGTSPLYVVNTIFTYQPTESQCIGAISLIIWSLIVSVCLKYATFILMADNHGEGGTFALCGLLTDEKIQLSPRIKRGITIIALMAAAMLLGDGALTPAVSVLSAIEGVAVEAPQLSSWVVPISIIIIVLLFLAQRWGTSRIGVTFGPIMVCWFITLFIIGVWRITYKPSIFKAFNPWEAFHYLLVEKTRGFYQIGGVYLSVTGLEALYADLGHFGRWPVRAAWFFIVFPGVLFNYLGQGALLIADPSLVDNPFYHSVPEWFHWPMVVLATVATIIASQAIITGSFSLVSQAIGMECSVPVKIYHTSKTIIGQIYIPTINYILMILTIIIVIGFGTNGSITSAYGVTVCTVMIFTTILYMCVMYYTWHKRWYMILPFGLFLIVDGYTWASNATKIPSGGWVAIVIATGFFIFGFCWFFGQLNLRRFLKIHTQTTSLHTLALRLGLSDSNTRQNSYSSTNDLPIISTASRINFHDEIDSDSDDDIDLKNSGSLPKVASQVRLVENVPVGRSSAISSYIHEQNNILDNTIPAVVTPSVGCFLTNSTKHTPHVFENYLTRTNSVPQVIIFLRIEHIKSSTIEDEKRLTIKQYGESIFHLTALYGYSENRIKPFDILTLARTRFNLPIPNNESKITIFTPDETIKVSTVGWASWIRRWPLYIYAILKSLYPGTSVNIKLAPENTISIGILAKLK
ncbi:hypothetical protein I4U23_005552 [Adineta vaga]|nr:hypothetical protein I4U23_005552 [Adineta vaga]